MLKQSKQLIKVVIIFKIMAEKNKDLHDLRFP